MCRKGAWTECFLSVCVDRSDLNYFGLWGIPDLDVKTVAIVIIGVAVLIFLAIWIWYIKRSRDEDEQIFEDMEGQEFESYCAELLEAEGFENVETTPGSHDYGVDIIADRDGITYAIQCKCYSDSIGIKAVQEAYAGRDYYGCMVGVVMTNQNFTKSAREFADKLNILLWDGDYVMKLIHEVAIPEKKNMVDFLRGIPKRSAKKGDYDVKTDTDAVEYMGQ